MEQERIDLQITGMTCAACAMRIEKGLNKTTGVQTATVNLALEKATVLIDPARISVNDVVQKIEKLGYGAHEQPLVNRDEPWQNVKLISAIVLAIPFLWMMVGHFSWLSFIPMPHVLMNPWLQLALATPVQFIIGWSFYVSAYKALRNGSANMDVLVALGTSAAYVYSVTQLSDAMGKLYFETSVIVITLILVGKWLEARAKGHSSDAIKKLMKLQPKTAIAVRDGQEVQVPLEAIVVGDVLIVKPGEQIAVDGEVIEGFSAVEEAILTGESVPVDKKAGDTVLGSTINMHGTFKMRALKVGKSTMLARMITLVEEAQTTKAPIQRLADTISSIFVPIVVAIAVMMFLIWLLVIRPGQTTDALDVLIAVLVIACPCALGFATPVSIMVGTGRAAERGILFKGGEQLEQTQAIDTIILDKTGTITEGKPLLTDTYITDTFEQRDVLRWVASAEKSSEHPLANAIVLGIQQQGIALVDTQSFRSWPGFGIEALVEARRVLVGTRALMMREQIEYAHAIPSIEELESAGKTVMLIAIDHQFAGFVAVADTIKPSSRSAIAHLQRLGLEVHMVTGDNERTARHIATSVAIKHFVAEVLPEGKVREVRALQATGAKVAMVGDGINDAPALAAANIGMAMGTGTDIAMEAGDVTLVRGDLASIAEAITVSKMTMRNIRQNLFWAFAYNVVGIPIAASGLLEPWIAGAAMAFSSVTVVLNALRLQNMKR